MLKAGAYMNDVFAFSWLPYYHFIQSLLLQIHCLECSCLHRSEYYSRSANDFILYLYCHFACLICIFHCNEFVFELNMHQPLNGISVIGLFSKRQSFPWKGAFVCVCQLFDMLLCLCAFVWWLSEVNITSESATKMRFLFLDRIRIEKQQWWVKGFILLSCYLIAFAFIMHSNYI